MILSSGDTTMIWASLNERADKLHDVDPIYSLAHRELADSLLYMWGPCVLVQVDR